MTVTAAVALAAPPAHARTVRSPITLPAAGRCVGQAGLTIRLRTLTGARWVRIAVTVDGRRVRATKRSPERWLIAAELIPAGRIRVSVSARTSDGRTATLKRTFSTCVTPTTRIATRITAVSGSSAARSAESQLDAALSSGPVAGSVQALLTQSQAEMTPLQHDLASLQTLFERPANRTLLASILAGKPLGAAAAPQLLKLLQGIAASPAIKALTAAGEALQHDPAQLAADVKALLASESFTAPTAGTGSGDLDAIAAALAPLITSPSTGSLATELGQILQSPGAIQYLQTLPPLLLASMFESAGPPAAADRSAVRPADAQPGACPAASSVLPGLLANLGIAWTLNPNGNPVRTTATVLDYALDFAGKFSTKPFAIRMFTVIGLVAVSPIAPELLEAAGDLYGLVSFVRNGPGAFYKLWQEATPPVLQICPQNATIAAGGSQTYWVEEFGFSSTTVGALDDLGATTRAQLSIIPDGVCDAYTCTATTAGTHTVIATLGAAKAFTELTVTGPPQLSISPGSAVIAAGASQAYTVDGLDADGKDLGADPNATVSITPDGSCTGDACTATVAGPHTVTATDGDVTARATLTIAPGPLDHLKLSPGSASVMTGSPETYTVDGYDAYGNDLGPDPTATLSITPDGSCASLQCTPAAAGPHTVSATDGTATGSASLVATGCAGVCATADGDGQVTLSWPDCGCGIYPDGPSEYVLYIYFDGVQAGYGEGVYNSQVTIHNGVDSWTFTPADGWCVNEAFSCGVGTTVSFYYEIDTPPSTESAPSAISNTVTVS